MKILILGDTKNSIKQIAECIAAEENYHISNKLIKGSFTNQLFKHAQVFDMIIIDISNYSMSEMEVFLDSTYYNSNLEEIVLLFVIDSVDDLPAKSSHSLTIMDYIIRPVNRLELSNKISLHLQYKHQIRKSTYLKHRALEATANAIAITEIDGRILWVNSAFTSLTGYRKEELIGESTRLLKSAKQDPSGYEKLWSTIISGKVWRGELINKRKNGSEYHEEMTITPLFDEYGISTHYIAIKLDITERKEREKQLLLDVNLAKQVQKGAISRPIETEAIQINALHLSSEHLSGDMCAWYKLSNNKYGIILYDVMGHGLSAALITMSIRSLLRGIITKFEDPEKVISELNFHTYNLFQDNDSFAGFYFTAIYVLVDLDKKEIQYVNAGHPPAILINDKESVWLSDGCLPCGILPKLDILKVTIPLIGTTKLCLYTDGLLDSVGVQRESIEKRIKKVEEIVCANRFKNNKDIINTLHEILSSKIKSDDICVVCIDILK